MFIFLSACSLLVPLSMIILGYTWKDKPPKDRQGSSGYRTTMSRMNDETWRYAHRCWGWINFVLGIILVILSIFILILTKDDTNFEMISVYLVFLQLGIMVLTIIPTEFLLHKHFTKQGMKKQLTSDWRKRKRYLEEFLIYEKRNKQTNLILYCISSVFHSVSYWLYEWK